MLDRKVAAIGLLAVLSVVWFAGARAFTTGAAPASQVELVRGAIHAGTCLNAEQQATVSLTNFSASGAPTDAAAPLLSYTEAPVALRNLLASPHALLITIGGDRNALLVCGEIRGSAEVATTSVDLSEQNDSGLSGVALLIGSGEGTQISVILNEAAAAGPAGTPVGVAQGTPVPATSPTAVAPAPSPTAAVPSPATTPGFPISIPTPPLPGVPTATPASAGPTPTAIAGAPPTFPIFLPPIAQPTPGMGTAVPPTVPSVPPTEVGTTPGTYTSGEFGYSLAIPEGWEIYETVVEPGWDYLALQRGENFVVLRGQAINQTAPECLIDHFDYLRSLPDMNLIIPHAGPDAVLATQTPEQAIVLWDLVLRNRLQQPVAKTQYVECRVLVPGQSVLRIIYEAPSDSFAAEASARQQILDGLSVP